MTISALSARLGPRKPSRPILVVDCLAIAAAVVLAHSPLGGVAHAMPDASQPVLGQAANVHTVAPGETVRSIAELYRVSSATVLAANAIENPDVLHVGEQLVVPSVDGALHSVSPGETLRTIADDYGVNLPDLVASNALSASPYSVDGHALLEANGLSDPDRIGVGTILVVPIGRAAAKPPPPAAPVPAPTAAPAPSRPVQPSEPPAPPPAPAPSRPAQQSE